MLTEDEANKRWCPFARVQRDGGGNRYPMDIDLASGHAFARCIASECMAWRWLSPKAETARTDNRRVIGKDGCVRADEPPAPPGEGWRPASEVQQKLGYVEGVFERSWTRPDVSRGGYCGLAGKP